jgi:hypothetical protein
MNNNNSIIGKFFSVITLLASMLSSLSVLAQEKTNQKIPIEIVEQKTPERPAKHTMALGVNIDPFPTILSAVSRDFGLGIQPWFGIDHLKIRLDIAHVRIPDTIAATKYFYKNNSNSFSLVAEYMFGNNFDGFVLGYGFGIRQNTISHEFFRGMGNSNILFFTVEGGYIWKFYNNVYLEPCLSLDIMLTRQTISIFGFTYKPLPVAGEITVKFGLYVDL